MESDCSNRECRVLQGTGYLGGTLGVFRVVWGYFGYCGVLSGTGVHWWYCGALVVLGCTGGTGVRWWYWGELVVLGCTGGTGVHWGYWGVLKMLEGTVQGSSGGTGWY